MKLTEDIIRMAREIWSAGNVYIGPSEKSLAQFAELVRADEREACARAAGLALLGAEMDLAKRVLRAIQAKEKT